MALCGAVGGRAGSELLYTSVVTSPEYAVSDLHVAGHIMFRHTTVPSSDVPKSAWVSR